MAGTANPSLTTYSFSPLNSTNATGSSTAVGSTTESTTTTYCGNGSPEATCTSGYSLAKYQPIGFTDTQGTQQAFGYNTTGDLTNVTTTSGSDSQTLGYDTAGNVTSSKDGNTNTTTYTWTSNFLTKVQQPAPLAAENFGPDSSDRVKWAEDGNLVFACTTYDGEDRTTRVDWKTGVTGGDCSTGTTSKWMTFTYDYDGDLTQRVDSSGNTTTYGYDYAGRRTSETFPSSRSNTYTYDRASNLTSLVDNDGTTSYTYDKANRLLTVTSPKPGSGTDTITYTYGDPQSSADSSKVSLTFPGGLKQQTDIDAAGNVTSVHVFSPTSVTLDKRDYSYQLSSSKTGAQILTTTDNAGNTTTYTPGAMNRLKDVVTTGPNAETWHYKYDNAGNRTLREHVVGATTTDTSYTYNAANELCASVSSATPAATCPATPTYTYDADGQRTSLPTASFDPLQRLTSLSGTSLSYLSPGNGELVSYGTTSYQNNLLGLSRIIPSSGTATDLIRATSGGVLAERVGTTSKIDLFTDALGSTIATADDGATTLSKHYSYDPDGNATATGTGTTPDTLYAGGNQIGNLYHYGARYYDPATASWTQQDPLNQISSLTQANHYTYAGGDAVDHADPVGTSSATAGCNAAAGEYGANLGYSAHNDRGKVNGGWTVGAGLGCNVTAYTGGSEKGSSFNVTACAGLCVSVGTSGVGLGAGFDVGITASASKALDEIF